MRIALDARTVQDHFPGIARYTFNLAQALAGITPPTELTLLYHAGAQNTRFDLAQLTARPNVRLAVINAPNYSLSEQWLIPGLLRQLHPHVYHSPYYIMPYRPGYPTIVTVHDLIPLLYPRHFTRSQRFVFGVTIRLSLRVAQKVIVVSRATANDLRALLNVPPDKVTIIPEAADPAMRRASPDVIAAIRARYHLPESYVLYVGSNKPHKNLTRLVEAFARHQNQSPITLAIGGHWDARYPTAHQRATELALSNRIQWLGPVPQADLPALYSGATLFIFPSLYEGFGLPVLEAMACGTPVVCSNISSLPEVIGDAGLLFDPLNVDTIATTIRRALENPDLRAELRQRGLARAAQFTWERVAEKTMAVYRAICQHDR